MGSMCSELCKSRNLHEQYDTYKLIGQYKPSVEQPLYVDLKTVLIYEDTRRNSTVKKFVLKSRKKYFLDVDTHMDFDFAEQTQHEQLEFLADTIETTLKRKYDVDVDKSYREWLRLFKKNSQLALNKIEKYADKEDFNFYVRLFYYDEYKTYLRALESNDKKTLTRFITNLVALINQDEYLFYKYFHSKPGTLKVNGTCGHFYAVAWVNELTPASIEAMSTWERKQLATKFLDLAHSLDTAFLKRPLQFCDVKSTNFGLLDDELKILDTDTVYADTYAFRARKCTSHDSCHFFDCKSYCDSSTHTCALNRINNNLQMFCEKIFNNTENAKYGLLTGIDDSEIATRLRKCQSPGFYKDSNVPIAADETLIRSLNILLKHNNENF